MIQQTSLEAWNNVKKKLSEKQEAIYKTIVKLGKVTDKQLAKEMCWEINKVTPRRLELFRAGLIKRVGYRYDGERRSILWSRNNLIC